VILLYLVKYFRIILTKKYLLTNHSTLGIIILSQFKDNEDYHDHDHIVVIVIIPTVYQTPTVCQAHYLKEV
jgi:hypothetical protein